MKEIIKNNSLNLIVAISFLLYMIQPAFTWFQADDYCLMQQLKNKSIFKAMIDDYLNWDGRFISLSYIIGRMGLKYQIFWLNPFISTILVLLICWACSKFIYKDNARTFKNTFLLLVIFWLGAFNFLSQTMYWSIGVVYIVEISIVVLIYLINEYKINIYLKSIIFLFISTISPNALIAILFIEILEIINHYKDNFKWVKLLPIISIFIGLLVVVLSPGNSNRMPNKTEIINNLTNPIEIYSNLKLMGEKILEFNSPIGWIILFLALISASQVKIKFNFISFLYHYRWIFGACITIFFFLPFPGFYIHSPRVNSHFFIFIFVFFIQHFKYENIVKFVHENRMIKVLFFVLFLIIISKETFDARISKSRMNLRESYLKSKPNEEIILKSSDMIYGPTTRKFYDVDYQKDFWLNNCVSKYFGVKSIQQELPPQKKSIY